MADNFVTLPELLKILDRYSHKEFHVHHTWRPERRDFNGKNQRALQNGMRNYHMKTNGWGDIAQHITVFPDGSILTGRGFSKTPISIKGYNTGGFMMEMVANFDEGHDKFDGKQKAVAIGIARYFDKKGRYIRFHNENAPKSCPGTSISKVQFMKEVRGTGGSIGGGSMVWYGIGSPHNTKSSVGKLQRDLVSLKFGVGSYGANGVMGKDTENAIKNFQRSYGLVADGQAGKITLARIKKELTPKAEIPSSVKYFVRASWENTKTQAGAFANLDGAIRRAKEHKGFKVYNLKGTIVYPESKVDDKEIVNLRAENKKLKSTIAEIRKLIK